MAKRSRKQEQGVALERLYDLLKREYVRALGKRYGHEALGSVEIDPARGQIRLGGGNVLDPVGDPEGTMEYMSWLAGQDTWKEGYSQPVPKDAITGRRDPGPESVSPDVFASPAAPDQAAASPSVVSESTPDQYRQGLMDEVIRRSVPGEVSAATRGEFAKLSVEELEDLYDTIARDEQPQQAVNARKTSLADLIGKMPMMREAERLFPTSEERLAARRGRGY